MILERDCCQRIIISILCFTLAMTSFIGFVGSETANAAVSPLITTYKPQVVNADANVSYIDSNGNTITGTIHHPGIAMIHGGFGQYARSCKSGGRALEYGI